MAFFAITNPNSIAIPDASTVPGIATSQINAYMTGTVVDAGVGLFGLTHTFVQDLDMLLLAPNATNNLLFMSDVGGGAPVTNFDLTFASEALPGQPPATLAPGTSAPGLVNGTFYLPTDYDPAETGASFGIMRATTTPTTAI